MFRYLRVFRSMWGAPACATRRPPGRQHGFDEPMLGIFLKAIFGKAICGKPLLEPGARPAGSKAGQVSAPRRRPAGGRLPRPGNALTERKTRSLISLRRAARKGERPL